jgi:membrane protease subunit HflK
MYLETMEHVLSGVNKTIIDPSVSKSGIVPYLPLNSSGGVVRPAPAQGGTR